MLGSGWNLGGTDSVLKSAQSAPSRRTHSATGLGGFHGRNRCVIHGGWAKFALLFCSLFFLSLVNGCANKNANLPPPEKRQKALQGSQEREEKNARSNIPIAIPPAQPMRDWPQAGGNASHNVPQSPLPFRLRLSWIASIGTGTTGKSYLLSSPVSDARRVYTIDSQGLVKAFALNNGTEIWQNNLGAMAQEDIIAAGGLALGGGKLMVTTGLNDLVALDTNNGRVLWRQTMDSPIRGAPMILDNRVVVLSEDNIVQTYLLEDGTKQWNQQGITPVAGMLGASTPAGGSGMVIAGNGAGELNGLMAESGRVLWSDSSLEVRRDDAAAAMPDIIARPVLDRIYAYAVRHSGGLFAVDIRNGQRIWNRSLASDQQPWIAGDYLYLVTLDGSLYCLTRNDGQTRWRVTLPIKTGTAGRVLTHWAGPILAGDRLILVSSDRQMVFLSPYDGSLIKKFILPSGAWVAPIVVSNRLIVQTSDGFLVTWR